MHLFTLNFAYFNLTRYTNIIKTEIKIDKKWQKHNKITKTLTKINIKIYNINIR